MPPGGRFSPSAGFCSSTVPGGSELSCSVIFEPSPAALRTSFAPELVLPTTPGTVTSSCPRLTVSVIVRPLVACRPAGTDVLMTVPSGTVSEYSRSTLVLKPASSNACTAASSSPPTTSGTAVVPGPADTRTSTTVPSRTSEPASGFCEITSSRLTSSLTTSSKSGSRPRSCRMSATSSASRPTRFGTVTRLPANRKYAPTASAATASATSAHTHQREGSGSTIGSTTRSHDRRPAPREPGAPARARR